MDLISKFSDERVTRLQTYHLPRLALAHLAAVVLLSSPTRTKSQISCEAAVHAAARKLNVPAESLQRRGLELYKKVQRHADHVHQQLARVWTIFCQKPARDWKRHTGLLLHPVVDLHMYDQHPEFVLRLMSNTSGPKVFQDEPRAAIFNERSSLIEAWYKYSADAYIKEEVPTANVVLYGYALEACCVVATTMCTSLYSKSSFEMPSYTTSCRKILLELLFRDVVGIVESYLFVDHQTVTILSTKKRKFDLARFGQHGQVALKGCGHDDDELLLEFTAPSDRSFQHRTDLNGFQMEPIKRKYLQKDKKLDRIINWEDVIYEDDQLNPPNLEEIKDRKKAGDIVQPLALIDHSAFSPVVGSIAMSIRSFDPLLVVSTSGKIYKERSIYRSAQPVWPGSGQPGSFVDRVLEELHDFGRRLSAACDVFAAPLSNELFLLESELWNDVSVQRVTRLLYGPVDPCPEPDANDNGCWSLPDAETRLAKKPKRSN